MPVRIVCAPVALALVTTALPAQAASYTKGVTLTQSSPTYNAAGATGAKPYEALTFTVSADGLYSLSVGTSGGYKPYLSLYNPGFDPAAPNTGLLQSAAYTSTNQFSVSFSRTLTANTTYIAVVAGDLFAAAGGSNPPQYFGQFGASGPGTITPGAAAAPVPELATWAMLVGGVGLLGATMRRRRTALRFA